MPETEDIMNPERRQSRFGPSEEPQNLEISRELFPGVVEAGKNKRERGGGKVVPKWEKTLQLANTPGIEGRDALLRLAKEQAEAALREENNVSEMTRIAKLVGEIDAQLLPFPTKSDLKTENGVGASPGSTSFSTETSALVEGVPSEPKEARLHYRRKIREIIRVESDSHSLTLKAVYDKLAAGLGFDPKRGFAARDLYPSSLGVKLDNVKDEVEAEIYVRCLLRAAEIKEEALKEMDRSQAAETYFNEMKGGGVPVLSRSHYKWLRGVDDRGIARGIDSLGENGVEALTTEKIDQVFSILLLMGEKDPKFNESWQKDFEKYRLYKINPETMLPENQGKLNKNFYDTGYPEGNRTLVEKELRKKFGNDAYTLAFQIFSAYKEEARFTWTHYLNRYYSMDGYRNALAGLTPPIYIGCSRVFTEGFRTIMYTDENDVEKVYDERLKDPKVKIEIVPETIVEGAEVKRVYITINGEKQKGKIKGFGGEVRSVALSPLQVKGVEDRVEDPQAAGEKVDKLKPGLYRERALRGSYLQETRFEDTDYVPDNKMPQAVSFVSQKDGEAYRKGLVAIGELGKSGEKGDRVNTAVATLAELRSTAESLIEAGAMSREESDKQELIEALNALWSLTILNPENIADLSHQNKAHTSFLRPSQINNLFEGIGGTIKGKFYIGSDGDYANLGVIAQRMKDETSKILESKSLPVSDSTTDDRDLVESEKKARRLKMPEKRGGLVVSSLAQQINEDLQRDARFWNNVGRNIHGKGYVPTERK